MEKRERKKRRTKMQFYRIMMLQVTWIRRKKDHQLLTVGLTTYASDERFQARHFQHSEDWTLQIKFVQTRDAGMYECQVSTHPPTSIFLFLEVVGKSVIDRAEGGNELVRIALYSLVMTRCATSC